MLLFKRLDAWKSDDPKELGDIEVETIGCVVKGNKVPSCEQFKDKTIFSIKITGN